MVVAHWQGPHTTSATFDHLDTCFKASGPFVADVSVNTSPNSQQPYLCYNVSNVSRPATSPQHPGSVCGPEKYIYGSPMIGWEIDTYPQVTDHVVAHVLTNGSYENKIFWNSSRFRLQQITPTIKIVVPPTRAAIFRQC